MLTIGRAKADLGDAAGAVPLLERVLTIRLASGTMPRPAVGDARWALAKALGEQDTVRALSLAEEARADYQGDSHKATESAAITEWLEGPPNHPRRISMR